MSVTDIALIIGILTIIVNIVNFIIILRNR